MIKGLKRGLAIATTTIISLVFIFIVSPKNVSADAGSIEKKWMSTLFYQCLVGSDLNKSVNKEDEQGKEVAKIMFNGGSTMYLPSFDYLGAGAGDSINCQQVLQGVGSISGVLSYGGVSSNETWGVSDATMNKLGYAKTADVESYEFQIQVSERRSEYTQRYTKTSDKSVVLNPTKEYDSYGDAKSLQSVPVKVERQSNGVLRYTLTSSKIKNAFNTVSLSLKNSQLEIKVSNGCNIAGSTAIGNGESSGETKYIPLKNNINDFYAGFGSLENTGITINCRVIDDNYNMMMVQGVEYTYTFMPGEAVISGDLGIYTWSNSAYTIMENFGGLDTSLTDDELYDLYLYYLNHAISITTENRISCEDSGNLTEVHLKDENGDWKIYYANLNNVSANEFAVKSGMSITKKDINFLISWFNSHPATALTDQEIEDCDDEPLDGLKRDDLATYSGDPEDTICYENAGALGWIACPLLSAMSKFMGEVYTYVEDNFLQVNTDVTSNSGSVHDAWAIIRDVANVAFIIFFLVVIFSQLTGYGIDNYGIKRMLPRLIITAVLVNLSFLICQITIDVSDILGVNIKAFLENLAPSTQTISAVGVTMTGLFETVAAGGILTLVTVTLGPGIIVGILLSVVSILISLIFLWLMLLARQIGIVIAIILAPAAIICYMLPNTEQYFKMWRKLMTALLLVYPLCALLIGGGTFVSSVMANIGNNSGQSGTPMLILGAMFIKVLPYFFIPTLLRRSMQGLSDLGGKITALGQRASRGASNAVGAGVKRTSAYKNLTNAANDREAMRTREAERNRLQRTVSRIKSTPEKARSQRQLRQLALAQSQLNRMEAEDVEAEVGVRPKDRAMLKATAETRRYQEDVDSIKSQNVMSGILNRIGEVGGYSGDGSDLSFEANTAAAQLYDFAKAGNKEGITAATEQLSEKGHHGQEAVRQVLSKLQAEGGNDAAIQAISSTVMNNGKMAADYKSGARSSYDYMAKAAAGEINGNINNLKTNPIKASNYSQQSFANMDKEELSRIEAGIKDGSISETEARALQKLAQDSLDNSLLQGGTKLKNEEVLSRIAGRSGEFNTRQSGDGASSTQSTGAGSRANNDRPSNVPYGAPSGPTGNGGENTDGAGI